MALYNDIVNSRERAISLLHDSHDYFTYTKGAWRILQLSIQFHGSRFLLRNLSTNSAISETDLLARAQRYVAQELTSATFQQFVSIFESFLFEVIRCWLLTYPNSLSSRQLSGKDIFALPDKAAIVDALVEKELNDIFYDRPANWFNYLKERTGIHVPTSKDTEQFAEIKATRDVLIHGQGIANEHYKNKAGKAARAQPGQPLDVSEPYHQTSWELIRRLVHEIGGAMADKTRSKQ